eukprot:m51a1_g10520 hypothetical protein (238) ;mRNA; r:217601-218621
MSGLDCRFVWSKFRALHDLCAACASYSRARAAQPSYASAWGHMNADINELVMRYSATQEADSRTFYKRCRPETLEMPDDSLVPENLLRFWVKELGTIPEHGLDDPELLDHPLWVSYFGSTVYYVNRVTSLLTLNHAFFAGAHCRAVNRATREGYAEQVNRQQWAPDYGDLASRGYCVASRFVLFTIRRLEGRRPRLFFLNGRDSNDMRPDIEWYTHVTGNVPAGTPTVTPSAEYLKM